MTVNAQTTPAAPRVDRLRSVIEVADRLGVAPKTVRKWARAGVIPMVRLTPTAQLRFRDRDVEAAIERSLREEQK